MQPVCITQLCSVEYIQVHSSERITHLGWVVRQRLRKACLSVPHYRPILLRKDSAILMIILSKTNALWVPIVVIPSVIAVTTFRYIAAGRISGCYNNIKDFILPLCGWGSGYSGVDSFV